MKIPKLKLKKDNAEENYFVLGHMIKYNIYLLSKSMVFSALCQKNPKSDLSDLVKHTNEIMTSLDLASSLSED